MPVNTAIQFIETQLNENSNNIAAIRVTKADMLDLMRNYKENDLLTFALVYSNSNLRTITVYKSDESGTPSGDQPYGVENSMREQAFCPPECGSFIANTLTQA